MHVQEIIGSHPDVQGRTDDALIRAIEEMLDCAQVCASCADACIGEANSHELKQCIRVDLDCAGICAATAAVASRRTGSNEAVVQQMLEVCAVACRTCAEECRRHADMHEHCRICAEACERCEQACRDARASIH